MPESLLDRAPGEPIAAGDLLLQPVSATLAAELTARDFHQVKLGDGWPHEDSLDGLGMVAAGRALGWLVTLDGLVVGECGTHGLTDGVTLVEIGYGLAAPVRGRGYGRELVRALSAWLLGQPGVTGLLAHTDPDNTPSRRSLESAGFHSEGMEDGECRYLRYPG